MKNNETAAVAVVAQKSEITTFDGQFAGQQMRANAVKVSLAKISRGLDSKCIRLQGEVRLKSSEIEKAAEAVDDAKKIFFDDPASVPAELAEAASTIRNIIAKLDGTLTRKEIKEKISLKFSDVACTLTLGDNYQDITFSRPIVFSKNVTARQDELAVLRAQRKDLSIQLQETELKICRLPVTRERIEATMAEADLRATDGGSDLLAAVGMGFGKYIDDPELQAFLTDDQK